jgi:hypothetical protein
VADAERTFVDIVLESLGLRPGPEEIVLFNALYPVLRQRADLIYSVDLGDAP